ncbi:peroxiredoxin [Polaribacter sp. MED152]|uniref:peroxiredoxin family protein n=1 Tax=Polaribacter sp. MED152 TaxID=313598 RepID=UPI000068CA52|nr:TlpA disulfide reductase family protein [Polaribacter sp. MED152]EAQ41327.1 redoxin [Polaribacter sp. MED152]
MRLLVALIGFLICFSCTSKKTKTLEKGNYRGFLQIQDDEEIPFLFEVENDTLLTIFNADEKIKVDEISYSNDSIKIQTPVFEGYILAKLNDDGLNGNFHKPSLDRIVPFKAVKDSARFSVKKKAIVSVTGNWETVFSYNSEVDKYIAKGIFEQKGNTVTGTFRTTSGDYRYLEGVMDGDTLRLSTFDGAHAFLFKAKATDSTLNGLFYSDNHWKEPFTAKLNPDYELPNEEELTYIKEGYEFFDFSFPDTRGRVVSLSDPEFQNKIIIIQIMGTWCPNCLDESKFLVNYLKENLNEDVQVISLAFEVAKTRLKAYDRINRLKEKLGIEYPVLLAQFGNAANKDLAQQKLPMLNHLISYPTTLFLDSNRKVRKIHTGFNGPAAGDKYKEFTEEFENFVNALLEEKQTK